MKKTITLLALFLCIKSHAQINIANMKLTDTSLRILYIGVDNAVLISGDGFKPVTSQVLVSGGGATRTLSDARNYVVKVTTVTDSCRIWIAGQNGKLITEKYFKVRTVPEPVATLANARDTAISREAILKNPSLNVILPGCYLKHDMKITAFTPTIQGKGKFYSGTVNGNLLTDEQLKLVKEMPSGNIIYVDHISAVMIDGSNRNLQAVKITVQ